MFLLFLTLLIYRHSSIVYLEGMRPMSVYTWTLVSLVVCLESLHGQSSIALAPQAIVAPSMHEDQVIFKPLGQIQLSRSTYKVTSYVDFALYVQSFKKFGTCLVNFTRDLYSPDIMKHFKEMDTIWLFWDRSKVRTIQNHYNCLESYQCILSKQYRRIQSELEYLGHIYSAVHNHFFYAVDHMDCHASKHVTPNPQSSKSTNCHRSRRSSYSSCKVIQYFSLSINEMKYLSKLKITLQKVNWKFFS